MRPLAIVHIAEIIWSEVFTAVALAAAVTLLFAVLIVVISRLFTLPEEDPRFNQVSQLLAGANCGGCGKAGCDAFAKALIAGEASLDSCGVTSKANKQKIAEVLGIGYSGGENVAAVACAGGSRCADKFIYQGYNTCDNEILIANGRKKCNAACLCGGTCADVCPTDAITVGDEDCGGAAKVLGALCISCGACVRACPKKIIKLISANARVLIACSNNGVGKEVLDICSVGCIACGLCEKNCPHGAITMENHLPRIDYAKCTGCMKCVKVCPRNTIISLVN